MADPAPQSPSPASPPVADAAYRALHDERESLERALVRARQEQQFGTDAAIVSRASAREATLLGELDRVLTLIRAAEVRRQTTSGAGRWR